MKPIKYDRHARRRMKDRDVTEGEVETVMNSPQYVVASIKGRMNAFKHIDGRYLRVTFKDEGEYLLVITATIHKRPFDEGESYENRI